MLPFVIIIEGFSAKVGQLISVVYLIYSEWSSLEKEMGDGLQKSGHYMDRSGAVSVIFTPIQFIRTMLLVRKDCKKVLGVKSSQLDVRHL